MRYAKDSRTGREVDAHDATAFRRSHAYVCPVCGGPVHYKRSIGLSPDPIFAHNSNTARPDCELYQPGFWATSASTAPIKSAEDSPEEVGMCLEDDGASWTTYLRLPEIAVHEGVRLRSLRNGSVEVEADGTRHSLPLLELRQGIGSGRIAVPPSSTTYRVSPKGEWPAALSQKPWQGEARGLNLLGTLFRMRRGEWVRLREGTVVELGEKLRVLGELRNAPPSVCSPEAGGTLTHRRINWKMWRVAMPIAKTASLERWAEDIDVIVRDAAWNVSLVSLPQSFNDEGRTPVVGTKKTLIGKLESPHKGVSTTALLRTGSSSQSLTLPASNDGARFIAFNVPWPGRNELGAGHEDLGFRFDTAPELGIAELRKAIGAVPRLGVAFGKQRIESWLAPYELPESLPGEESPAITIEPDLEGLRLSLNWRGEESVGSEEGLTMEAVKYRLQGFWGTHTEVRIGGGGIGTISLIFRCAKEIAHLKRASAVLPWTSIGMREGAESASAWMLRRAAVLDPKVLRVTQQCRGSRWMPLVISKVRKSRD